MTLNTDTVLEILLLCEDKDLSKIYLVNAFGLSRKILTSATFWLRKLESVDVLLDYEEGEIDPLVLRETYFLIRDEVNTVKEFKSITSARKNLKEEVLLARLEALCYTFEEIEDELKSLAKDSVRLTKLRREETAAYNKILEAFTHYGIVMIELPTYSSVEFEWALRKCKIDYYEELTKHYPSIYDTSNIFLIIETICKCEDNEAMLNHVLQDPKIKRPECGCASVPAFSNYASILILSNKFEVTIQGNQAIIR